MFAMGRFAGAAKRSRLNLPAKIASNAFPLHEAGMYHLRETSPLLPAWAGSHQDVPVWTAHAGLWTPRSWTASLESRLTPTASGRL